MVLVPALVLGFVLDSAGSHHFAGQGTLYSAPPGQELILPGFFPGRLSPATFLGNLFFLQTILVEPLGSNQPLWSLANEFWYYLAFPCLALALLLRIKIWQRALAVLAMAGILVFVGPKIAVYFSIWLLGAGAAAMPLTIPRRFQRIFVWAALALFVAGNLLVRYGNNLFPVDFFLGCLFLILLYGLMHLQEPSRDGIYRRTSKFMSSISYSMYLTHGPIFCLMSAVLVGSFRLLPLNGHTVLILAEVVAIAFAAACAVHYLFEARTDRVRNYLEARL